MPANHSKLKSWIINHDILIVWALICIYIIYFSLYTCAQHYNFKTYAFDLGIFSQSTWYAAHYGALINSLEISQHPINHLAIHFSPILYLAVPFYFLFPDPKTILILQSVALSITALPCYLLAKAKINNIFICLIIAVSFLLYPPLHNINLYDFHPVALAVPILFCCLYFLEKQKYGWFWVFFILSLLIKENVILTGIGIGAYIFITKRKFLFGIIIAAISATFFKDGVLVLKKNYNASKNKITINEIYKYNLLPTQKPVYNHIYIGFNKFIFLPKFLRKILQHKYIHIKWLPHQSAG